MRLGLQVSTVDMQTQKVSGNELVVLLLVRREPVTFMRVPIFVRMVVLARLTRIPAIRSVPAWQVLGKR